MTHEDYDRQPRWNTAGYWTDRREGEDWQGDRSNARRYDREDMRRYSRRALQQGEELRRLRGQRPEPWDSQLDTDQIGVHAEHVLDLERYQGRDWGYDRELGRQGRGFAPPPYAETRKMKPGSEYRRQPGRRAAGGQGRQRFQIEPGWVYPRDREPGDNLVDNYWGRREMDRDYVIRDRGAWWNNVGGRPDLTSARHYRNDLPTGPRFDWIEDEEFDLDPGYEYEFGTDYDFLESMRGAPNRQVTTYRSPWYVPGPYAGMGPAGYHPSDERIKENICEIFSRNGHIDCSRIDVQVENGVVKLNGNVNRRAEKYLAEDIASAVGGVVDVDNRIHYPFKGGSAG